MVEINGKQFCENCFEEISTPVCTRCGYRAGMSDPTMLTPGSVLLGKYIVGRVMGKGGFGVTYLAYDVSAGRKVAIKEFFPYGIALRAAGTATVSVASMDNAEAFKLGAEKFYNEAKLVAKFNGNPNIVGVYEFFYENDTVYFAMEYLKGHTLKEHIQEYGTLTAPQALFIIQNVSNALMAAHSSSVLHRDISPDNIIICDNGDVKLIDFGAARQVVAEHSQSLSVILKPGFAPLEQYQKKGNQGSWTDIYSLGATIYYALTEDIPEDPMSRLDDDEAFSSNQYNVNPELWKIIAKATQLKIEDRYGDIFQLKNDLSTLTIEPEPLVAPNEQSDERMPDFRTAMPYGMTQAVSQPATQPVGVGAPVTVPVSAPAPAGSSNAAYGQPVPNGAPPAKKRSKGKIAAICGAVAVAAAAAVIIPIALNSSKDKPAYDPSVNYSAPQSQPNKTENVTDREYSFTKSSGETVTLTYTGEWANNMPNGQGKGAFASGNVYEGEWKDGTANGQGKCTYANGDVYEGEWKDGKSNGQGKGTFANGDVYEGEWKDDKLNGQGTYTWADGQVYKGEWKDGKRNGYGCAYMIRSGNDLSWIREGTYSEGMLSSGEYFGIKGSEYDFKFGTFNSDGKLTGAQGYIEYHSSSGDTDYYIGTFDNGGIIQGEKIACRADYTSVFVGSWNKVKNAFSDGYSIRFDASGKVSGRWKYTNGEYKEISADEWAKISEMKKYTWQYKLDITSNRYGHKTDFNALASDLATFGGPSLY